MLCSSYDGVLRLFAVWPQDEDASFENLRAKGGFLVSAALKVRTNNPHRCRHRHTSLERAFNAPPREGGVPCTGPYLF
jgi:hypothetical protein